MPRLVMMSGLPGSGKSTLSRLLAARTGAELLRVDVFEQDLRNTHGQDFDVGAMGYRQGYDLAAHYLAAGKDVIADAVNAVEAARQGWRDVASAAGAGMTEVELVCSATEEVRDRLRTRDTGIDGLAPVEPDAALSRHWERNPKAQIRLDTAGRTVGESLAELERLLSHTA